MNVAEARTQDSARGAGQGELDQVTLRRAQKGEPDACRALVEHYQRQVFGLLHRMLGPARRDRVEDLAQETFLGVFRSLAGFAPLGPARLSTWILTIASRRAVDELRRAQRAGQPRALGEDAAAAPERTDDRARTAQLRRAVTGAVADLSPPLRAAFLLREYHGFEYAEIARALDIDMGTVKSRLSRARAALRQALAELGEEDAP